MKTLLFALSLLVTSQSFAAKCVISGLVLEGKSCHRLSTRLDVTDAEACEAYTKATQQNRFFNILEPKQELLSVRFKFVDRPNRVKLKKEFKLTAEDTFDLCLI
jgi:hypothetical protein